MTHPDGRVARPSALDLALARLRSVTGRTVMAEPMEISTGPEPDPCGRNTVKPVRGAMPDAPVERHVPGCPLSGPCFCGPVDVAAFQAKTLGQKTRDGYMAPSVKTLSTAPMHAYQAGGPVDVSGNGAPAMPDDDELAALEWLDTEFMDAEIRELETLDEMPTHLAPAPARPAASMPANVATVDVHVLCRKERDALTNRAVRAEYGLKIAQARIAKLEAEMAQLAPQVAKLTGANKELAKAEKSAKRSARKLGKELAR